MTHVLSTGARGVGCGSLGRKCGREEQLEAESTVAVKVSFEPPELPGSFRQCKAQVFVGMRSIVK